MSNVAAMQETLQLIERYEAMKAEGALYFYAPYEKQKLFHEMGCTYSQRCLGAGNQLGKTFCGAAEAAYHSTGLYPDDWEGAKFAKPTVGWVCGVSGEVIRDTTQKLLVGRIQDEGQMGTGSIPKSKIQAVVKAMGINGLLDHVKVRHVTGGTSLIFFKSYEKGREKFQGETIDWVWYDEEPPEDIYTEGLVRTNNGQLGQFAWLTFTPLKGMTNVVAKFYQEPSPDQILTMMTIWDVDHYTDAEKQKIIDSYPAHERDARSKGIPTLGDGRVYPISEDRITCTPFKIPRYWPIVKGIDFGYDHPAACVSLAYDPDNDIIYVFRAEKARELSASQHAIVINGRDSWIPVAWPHDGLQHEKGSGKQLAEIYRENGVNMMSERATFPNGSNSVEPGISDILDRMMTGRFKVFCNLEPWLEEFRLYHRKASSKKEEVVIKIVKIRDDLLDATRYALMMIREGMTIQEHEFDGDYEARNEKSVGYW